MSWEDLHRSDLSWAHSRRARHRRCVRTAPLPAAKSAPDVDQCRPVSTGNIYPWYTIGAIHLCIIQISFNYIQFMHVSLDAALY